MRTLYALTITLSLAAAGCASDSGTATSDGPSGRTSSSVGDFKTKVNQIQPGTTKPVVLRELGKPDVRRSGVAGAQPTGPQPPITVPAGSRYEQWTYYRGDSEYHVFMGPSVDHPGTWAVQSVSANPKSASALQRQ
jgi:hypothetical protein